MAWKLQTYYEIFEIDEDGTLKTPKERVGYYDHYSNVFSSYEAPEEAMEAIDKELNKDWPNVYGPFAIIQVVSREYVH